MPKYTIIRTVDIELDVEAETLAQALEQYYLLEALEGEFSEVDIDIWNNDTGEKLDHQEIEKAKEQI
jgi:hypothetical protein